jgi:palmitoyltransferase
LSERTLGVTTLYVVLVLGLFMCLALTALSDPGVVCAKDDRSSHIVDAARRGALRDTDFCPTCLIQRPARAKHDPTLKRCVRRFDHYCPFVANVVGERNYRFFYAFLVCCVLAISLHLAVVLPRVGLCDGEEGICLLLPKHAPIFVGCLLALIHDVWVACMLVMHSSLVCTDQTTYEQMHGRGGGDCSASNCRRVLAPAGPVATPASVELV